MRTNSRGSVTSGPDETTKPLRPPLPTVPSNAELSLQSPAAQVQPLLTPPEIFPKDSAGDATTIIDMDVTPRPGHVGSPPEPRMPNKSIDRSFLDGPSR